MRKDKISVLDYEAPQIDKSDYTSDTDFAASISAGGESGDVDYD